MDFVPEDVILGVGRWADGERQLLPVLLQNGLEGNTPREKGLKDMHLPARLPAPSAGEASAAATRDTPRPLGPWA